jgi:transposase
LHFAPESRDVDPQAWLADVLAGIGETLQTKLAELLPWNWDGEAFSRQQAA